MNIVRAKQCVAVTVCSSVVTILVLLLPKYNIQSNEQLIMNFTRDLDPLSRYYVDTQDNSNQNITMCSVDFLQNYMVTHEFFASEGNWTSLTKGNETYSPKGCVFQHATSIPSEYLTKCLLRTSVRKILLLGDSNGRYYFNALIKMLVASNNFECVKVKGQVGGNFKSDPEYFTKGTNISVRDVITQPRICRTCKSELQRCTEKSPSVHRKQLILLVEVLVMEFYLDAEVISLRNNAIGNCPPTKQQLTCHHHSTSQEFIFMEYLKGNYPDLVIIFGNSHSIRRKEFHQIKPAMAMFSSIVLNTVPRSTSVVWVPGSGEYDPKRPKEWQGVLFGPDNNTAQEMITKVNQALFETLKPSLRTTPTNMFAFFDLQSVSNPVLPIFSSDGVHFQTVWYDRIMSYLVQSVCNSDSVYRLRQHVSP